MMLNFECSRVVTMQEHSKMCWCIEHTWGKGNMELC